MTGANAQSKSEPRAELTHARSRNAIQVMGHHLAEIRRSDLGVGTSESMPVENIKHLEAQAQHVTLLIKSNRFADAGVLRGYARVAKLREVAGRIPKLSV